ncbi:MAG TPA: CerR family C-terminal domain-containing protein [Pararobbsia sp.]|nr:CerR family C-terminal domain-containing protein [Pararobbsia sp.]
MNRTSRPRHSAESGYQRGEETRARIVSAAIRLFGDLGFDGASTRDIAASAGVNAPALQYYFDNKEGVYAACLRHIIDRVWSEIETPVRAAERFLADEACDDDTLVEAYLAIQDRTVEFMFQSAEAEEWRLFMAREQAGLGAGTGFNILKEQTNRCIVQVKSSIVGRLLGLAPDDEETLLCAMALGGSAHVFHIMRLAAFKTLGWEDIDVERLMKIRRVVRLQTTQLLHAMIAEREERREASREPQQRAASVMPAARKRVSSMGDTRASKKRLRSEDDAA